MSVPKSLAYLNGEWIPTQQLCISSTDAGFVYGATVTDYCRTYSGKLFRWADHLRRFRSDCERCGIPLIHTDEQLSSIAEELVRINRMDSELAVITFATPGPIGYLTGKTENGPPTLGMQSFPIPVERYRRFYQCGVQLVTAGSLHADVPLSVKHRSRLAWWLAQQKVESGAIPVLTSHVDHRFAADTPLGAIMTVRDGIVHRSAPSSVLESVSLQVAHELCTKLGIEFRSDGLDRSQPDEVILVGSAFGIAGVSQWDDLHLSWPGPITMRLIEAWSEETGCEVTMRVTVA